MKARTNIAEIFHDMQKIIMSFVHSLCKTTGIDTHLPCSSTFIHHLEKYFLTIQVSRILNFQQARKKKPLFLSLHRTDKWRASGAHTMPGKPCQQQQLGNLGGEAVPAAAAAWTGDQHLALPPSGRKFTSRAASGRSERLRRLAHTTGTTHGC